MEKDSNTDVSKESKKSSKKAKSDAVKDSSKKVNTHCSLLNRGLQITACPKNLTKDFAYISESRIR